jgi:hypothetical protein
MMLDRLQLTRTFLLFVLTGTLGGMFLCGANGFYFCPILVVFVVAVDKALIFTLQQGP